MPPSVSTGDWDAIVRQIRWCHVISSSVQHRNSYSIVPCGSFFLNVATNN